MTLALALVTLTPSCFARATISTLFLAETAWEILDIMLVSISSSLVWSKDNVLCGVGLVVHKKEVNITGVVNEESLVAGWHHVAGLLVGTETNLYRNIISPYSIDIVPSLPDLHRYFHLESNKTFQYHCRWAVHTDGITICPLKRLRTRLSIPLGFLQLASTHL